MTQPLSQIWLSELHVCYVFGRENVCREEITEETNLNHALLRDLRHHRPIHEVGSATGIAERSSFSDESSSSSSATIFIVLMALLMASVWSNAVAESTFKHIVSEI